MLTPTKSDPTNRKQMAKNKIPIICTIAFIFYPNLTITK